MSRSNEVFHAREPTSDTAAIAAVTPPWRWRVTGTIEALCIDPRDPASVEARVADASGWLVAKWRGWTSLHGLAVRRTVILEGFADIAAGGCKLMLEPELEIVSDG
jgi:hypothetical protein